MNEIGRPGQVVENPFAETRCYRVIYADPPWRYRDSGQAGKRGAVYKYPVLSNQDVASLPVAQIAAEDSTLFLWVTWPKLPEVLPIIDAWGFTYRTVAFVWVKRTRVSGALAWGMGNWTRANTEPCLLATRGKPKRTSAGIHQVVESPVEAHSRKPREVRERIVRLMGDVPRLELFAREAAPGWDAWGSDLELAPTDMDGRSGDAGKSARSSDASRRQARSSHREVGYDLFETPKDGVETQPEPTPYSLADGDRRRLVLQFAKANEQVTRGEVASVCGLDPEEASAVLRALEDEGLLRRRGRSGTTWYEPVRPLE